MLEVGFTGVAPHRATTVTTATRAPLLPDEPRRRLSVLRLFVALLVLAGIGLGGFFGAQQRLLAGTVTTQQTWFAPYVDVTLTPTYQFQNPSADAARQSVLGFVVAAPDGSCAPSWGGAYTLSKANTSLVLASRIAQVQQNGAKPIVSFGGRDHVSLDVACQDVPSLVSAYQSVVNAYGLTTIDLDIEGAALDNFSAEKRRAAALAALERADPRLGVWLTLPVEANGLQANALSVISSMLRDRVSITGINVMTMDFTHAPGQGNTMLGLVTSALNSVHQQLSTLYPSYGVQLKSQQIWQRLGATVMIGQNDFSGQIFTINDARGLVQFAQRTHLGRVSMWSINRDSQCGSAFPENGLLSNTCSGTAQGAMKFSQIFGQLGGGVLASLAAGNVRPLVANTNPADAPYPQWSAAVDYPVGYKVVADGEIFQAKWYNTGQDPRAQIQYAWQTPWELLGPVLPGDHAPVIALPSPGTYPNWALGTLYHAGAKVIYNGLPYQTKWTNQGTSPGTSATDPFGSPWKPLYKIPGEPVTPATPGL